MDLERTGKSVTGRFTDCTEVCDRSGTGRPGPGPRNATLKAEFWNFFKLNECQRELAKHLPVSGGAGFTLALRGSHTCNK